MKTRLTGRAAAVAAVVLGVAAIGGSALAGHIGSDVKSYTGCLGPNDGTISKVAQGDAPKSPCNANQAQIHLSGGDITSVDVQAGGGITGGGTNGAASLSLRRDCSSGQIVKWDGSAWTCAADNNSTYTNGTGLDLTGSELSVKESYRLPQNCASDEAVTRNPAVGGGAATWTCGQFAKADQSCAGGQFARGVTAIGTLSCSAPSAAAPPAAFEASASARILEDSAEHEVVRLQLPAGRYAVTSTGDVGPADITNSDIFGHCSLNGPTNFDLGGYSLEESGVALGGIFTLSAAGSVYVTCIAQGDDPSEADFEIVAITVS